MRAVIETALRKCPPSYMCDWAVRTDKAGRQDWESNYQHYSDIGPISFFFFFKLWYLAENKREKIAFPIYPYWGRCKTPYLHCLMTFDVWFWRQKSSNENERNVKTVTMATNPLSTMSFHWSLGIFVIISPVFRWYLNQFSTDFHVILQAPPATIAATALRSW